MIKILRKLFSRRLRRKEPEDVMKIARLIGPLIDKTAKEIFMSYQTRLLTQPISYIVPAVWGTKKEGELEDTQKEINRQIIPVIKELFAALESKDLDAPQEYAIGFLILISCSKTGRSSCEPYRIRLSGTMQPEEPFVAHFCNAPPL